MKIHYIETDKIEKNQILIALHPRFRELHKQLLSYIEDGLGMLEVYDEYHDVYPLPILKIYYIEVIDNKRFVYTKDSIYRTHFSLRDLKERLKPIGFCQINVRTLVNVFQIKHYSIEKDCKRHIKLKNDEKLVINRNYKDEFNQHIQNFMDGKF